MAVPHRPHPLVRQVILFGVVGVVGFAVDAGVLTLLLQLTRVGFYLGRIVSFLSAASVTWILNKHITFRGSEARHNLISQWGRFLGTQTVGGTVNFAVYSLLLWRFPVARAFPIIAVGAGSLSGLLVNFVLARALIFRFKDAESASASVLNGPGRANWNSADTGPDK